MSSRAYLCKKHSFVRANDIDKFSHEFRKTTLSKASWLRIQTIRSTFNSSDLVWGRRWREPNGECNRRAGRCRGYPGYNVCPPNLDNLPHLPTEGSRAKRTARLSYHVVCLYLQTSRLLSCHVWIYPSACVSQIFGDFCEQKNDVNSNLHGLCWTDRIITINSVICKHNPTTDTITSNATALFIMLYIRLLLGFVLLLVSTDNH